jgi:hypothetical protein
MLLGCTHIDSLALDPTPAPEERVGNPTRRAAGEGTDQLPNKVLVPTLGRFARDQATAVLRGFKFQHSVITDALVPQNGTKLKWADVVRKETD